MGLFDKILHSKATPKKRAPYKKLSPDDQRKNLDSRAMRKYFRENPSAEVRYGQMLMEKNLGLTENDPIKQMVETVKKLRDAGITVDPNADGSALERLAELGGKFLSPTLEKLAEKAAVAATEQQEQAPKLVKEKDKVETEEPAKMSMISRVAISQLNGRTPEQGAQWFLGQPMAGQVVATLKATHDDQLLNLLSEVTREYPDLAGLCDWLRQNPQWFVQCVRILRGSTEEGSGKKPAVAGL